MSRDKSMSSGFGLFTANKIQSMTENRASLVGVTASQNTGSIQTSLSASFRYDQPGQPLKSTQQININWAKFENHTFFNSAEAKVNMAFETIINGYPFDGTKDELFQFEDRLTGFEKYVLESMPQYTGFMNFNNSQFIEVTDRAGTLYPTLSRDTTSRAVLDPGVGPFTYEMSLFLPLARGGNQKTDKQVIAQKIKSNNGITLYTEPTPLKKVTITYTGQPADGNTVSLISSDGTQKTYEFDPTVVNGAAIGSNVGVRIGTNADDTYGNLKLAITGTSGHGGKIVASHTNDGNNAGSITVRHLVSEINDVSIFASATVANTTLPASNQSSTTQSDVVLLVTSGSVSAKSRVTLSRGKWHHVSACLNRNPGVNRIEFYVDGKFIKRSPQFEILDFQFRDAPLFIGKGTNITSTGDISAVTFNTSLSASIDEFRIFHSSRSHTSLEREKSRKVEPRDTLKLNLPFNEPTGSYNNQDVVLDHSGNSLHTKVFRTGSQPYDPACRIDPGYGNPMPNESPRRYPVLFPSHPDLVSFNTRLMTSASNYDTNNPNMITKLVPDHYLREAHLSEGFDNKKELGDSEDLYGYDTDFPGGGKMGSPQIIAALLFVWAKQFDEMKLFLDQFGKVLNADYIEEDTAADTFLPFMAEYYGFDLPNMFPNVSLEQLVDREGQGTAEALAKLSIQQIQNSIWRRVLTDIREIIRSKGTIHGIKTFLRNVGIDPDRSFRFREYGGARTGRVGVARQEVKDIVRLLSFTGSLASNATSTEFGNPSGKTMVVKRYADSPLIVSPFLSGTRVEGGSPKPSVPASQFILANSSSYTGNGEKILKSGKHVRYGVSPNPSDGLFTSGSWTCEAMYVYGGSHTLGLNQPVTQSLMRMYVTGTIMNGASSETAVGKISFNSQPADSSTLTLVDAESFVTTSVFEFDTVAKVQIDTDATSARLGNNATTVTITPSGGASKIFIFTTGADASGTVDGSGRIRVKTVGVPNTVTVFDYIADQLVKAINSVNDSSHWKTLTASRVGNIVSIEPTGFGATTVTKANLSGTGANDITLTSPSVTGANIRVPISPRGVSFTAKNLTTQINATRTSNATATITYTGQPADGNTLRLTSSDGTIKTYEFESGGGVTAGNVAVTISGDDADATYAALKTAIDGASGHNAGSAGSKIVVTHTDDNNNAGTIKFDQAVAGLSGNTAVTATIANTTLPASFTGALGVKALQLGDGKSIRLEMNSSGTPSVTKIATAGTPNTSITHFAGGFDDDILNSSFSGGGAAMTGRTMLTNLVALSGSLDMQTTGSLVLFARPIPGRDPLVLALTGTNVFDGNRWNVCYGRIRNDLSGTHVSSSYFLHATKAVGDRIVVSNRVEKIFDDHETELSAPTRQVIRLNGVNAADTVTLTSDDGTAKTYKFFNDGNGVTGALEGGAGTPVKVSIQNSGGGAGNNSEVAAQFLAAIKNNTNGHGSNVAASNGSIVVPAKSPTVASLKTSLDGTSFTIQDASGVSQKFTYFVSHDELTVGRIGIKSDTTIEDIAKSIKLAIELSNLGITPGNIVPTGGSDGVHTIPLVQDVAGSSGNQSFSTVGTASPAMTYNNFTNGFSEKMTVQRFDDSIVLTQSSNIAVTVSILTSAKSAGRITKLATSSAVNMNAFSNVTSINTSGSFIAIGDMNDTITDTTSKKTYGLDGYNLATHSSLDVKQAAMAQTTKFAGNIANIRFYSKALTEKEHREHALNLRSIGVESPSKNFSFAENIDGSFEKLRLDVSIDQDTTGTNAAKSIILSDFSQNLLDMEGYGFEATKQVVFPRDEKFSILSPNFDQSSQTNKVRVRSYLDPAVARRELVGVAPVYHIPEAEKVHDDLRFGVEISVTQALNEDIVNILATMEEIENAVGAPESQFDVGYLGLENIREVYFNRLTDKINLSNFFHFFRWFDNTIGDSIHRLIPRKTRFTGVNYIIEPHLLERPKFTYNTSDMYIGENDRHGLKGEILLRQLVAIVRRF